MIPFLHQIIEEKKQRQNLEDAKIQAANKREIKLYYIIPGVEIPVEEQLRKAKLVLECCREESVIPPSIAAQKAFYLSEQRKNFSRFFWGLFIVLLGIGYLLLSQSSWGFWDGIKISLCIFFIMAFGAILINHLFVLKEYQYDNKIKNKLSVNSPG